MSINSNNPFSPPIINPRFFTAPVDMVFAKEGFRQTRHFFSARAWGGCVRGELPATAKANTDNELEAYVRQDAMGLSHPVSTLAMSAKEATYGVVDPDLKVKKVRGLRVVDASVIVSKHVLEPGLYRSDRNISSRLLLLGMCKSRFMLLRRGRRI